MLRRQRRHQARIQSTTQMTAQRRVAPTMNAHRLVEQVGEIGDDSLVGAVPVVAVLRRPVLSRPHLPVDDR